MDKSFVFNLKETAGAIGDYGTILPIVIGVSIVTDVSLPNVLVFFAISFIATGIYYKLPMPVEPMKAIGVVAISGSLSANEIAGSSIVMGLMLLGLTITGSFSYIKKSIPLFLIRGVQFGLALILIRESLNYVFVDWELGLISIIIVLLFTILPIVDISSLVVFIVGISISVYYHSLPTMSLFSIPDVIVPTSRDLLVGFLNGSLPQLPLTIGNAILATSLLIDDLFDSKVSENKLMVSMGLMCLLSAPFGGFPMCHGSGGLAAQYRFGARTGASNIISGVILLVIALFFASPDLVKLIPYGALGALLLFSGIELIKSAVKTNNAYYTIITGVAALFFGITTAFGLMLFSYWILSFYKNIRLKKHERK